MNRTKIWLVLIMNDFKGLKVKEMHDKLAKTKYKVPLSTLYKWHNQMYPDAVKIYKEVLKTW